jgi:putative two-component system response regulator
MNFVTTDLQGLEPMSVCSPTELRTILIVDDAPENIAHLSAILKSRYKVKAANGGKRALTVVENGPPDLILLDVIMPDIDGYDVCRALKKTESTKDIPIIFLTALADQQDEEKGLQLGAVDYILKPINPAIVLARIKTHLQLKSATDALKNQNHYLEQEVTRRTAELHAIQDVTIFTLASLAETRDNETGSHIRRTQHYLRVLANYLQSHPRFAFCLADSDIDLMVKSAPLHDIGKVGIPDSILLKPGRLTPEEFEIMKTHTTLGRDAIVRAEQELGIPVDFLVYAKEIAYSHQEKWDGSGYPEGLKGNDIPVSGRLMAIADVYDALISRRVYKEPMSHEQAVDIILQGKGSHFDPDIVDAFIAQAEVCREIAVLYAD